MVYNSYKILSYNCLCILQVCKQEMLKIINAPNHMMHAPFSYTSSVQLTHKSQSVIFRSTIWSTANNKNNNGHFDSCKLLCSWIELCYTDSCFYISSHPFISLRVGWIKIWHQCSPKSNTVLIHSNTLKLVSKSNNSMLSALIKATTTMRSSRALSIYD